jgi:activating signal cointegrator 1
MKAISIWQPYASLIAMGEKTFETRSWSTKHTGPLLVCSSRHKLYDLQRSFLLGAIRKVTGLDLDYLRLPFGKAICVVDLVACLPSTDYRIKADTPHDSKEFGLGDFSPGRFAWKLENVRQLEPFPVRGRQGIFDVEDHRVADALMRCGQLPPVTEDLR